MHYRISSFLKKELRDSQEDIPNVRFVLILKNKVVCPQHNKGVQESLERIIISRGIEIVRNFFVQNINEAGDLISSDGRTISLDKCVWVTGVFGQKWIADSGFDVSDLGGFFRVRPTLESYNTPNVFAAGDCADIIGNSRPKAGVFAVRQGPPLAENLRLSVRKLMGVKVPKDLVSYEPQTAFLGIISAGPGMGVASKGDMVLQGDWLWFLKDWIDRNWLASYSSQLPLMGDSEESRSENLSSLDQLTKTSKMRCGGCGAKVGKRVLDRVMKNLYVPTRSEVILGLDSPDDCAVVAFNKKQPQFGVAQTVDFFRSFLSDPFIFGKIAANHALSDCYAMCAQPVSAMAIAVLPFGAEDTVERDLAQLMGGVAEALSECNCALVGGHSCEGQELSLGLSVSGIAYDDDKTILKKGGVRLGDVLVLTKPLGTGTIFAGEMRVLSTGSWVQGAIESMLLPNKQPAILAKNHGANACTDVTGFGLVGHLVEMMRASDQDLIAELELSDIPLLEGALELVSVGVFSSLQAENQKLKHAILNHSEAVKQKCYPLIFDPQTSGGLLISLPAENVEGYMESLVKDGSAPFARIIGRISSSSFSSVKWPIRII